MADGNHVPVTVQGTLDYPGAYVAIGTQGQGFSPGSNATNANWFLVLDLTTLQPVANEVSADSTAVPPSVQQYAGNSQYLLLFVTMALRTDNLPQGTLYQFLQKIGSGYDLARAEQVNEQLGTGTWGNVGYILAATMAEGDTEGFEELSFNYIPLMTFELMPVTIDGKTTYVPIRTGT